MRLPVLLLLLIALAWGCSKSAAEGPDERTRLAQLEHENRVLKFRNELEKAVSNAESPEHLCNEWNSTMSRYSDVSPSVDVSSEKKMYTKRLNRLRTRILQGQEKQIQNRCVQEGVGALRSWMESQGAYGWQVDAVENIRSAVTKDGLEVASTVKVRKERFLIDDRAEYIITVTAQMSSECSSDLTYKVKQIGRPESGGEFQ